MAQLIGGTLGNWSHDNARRKSLEQAAQRVGLQQGAMGTQVPTRPEFDWGQQARDTQIKADTINQESSANAANNIIVTGINDAVAQQQAAMQAALDAQAAALAGTGSQGPESPRVSAYLRALRRSNNADADDRSLQGHLGTYSIPMQVLDGKKGGWDKQALGRNISTEEFLNSKMLQNQIARFKFKKYLSRLGETGALEKWHKKTGNPEPLQDFISQVLNQLQR